MITEKEIKDAYRKFDEFYEQEEITRIMQHMIILLQALGLLMEA